MSRRKKNEIIIFTTLKVDRSNLTFSQTSGSVAMTTSRTTYMTIVSPTTSTIIYYSYYHQHRRPLAASTTAIITVSTLSSLSLIFPYWLELMGLLCWTFRSLFLLYIPSSFFLYTFFGFNNVYELFLFHTALINTSIIQSIFPLGNVIFNCWWS